MTLIDDLRREDPGSPLAFHLEGVVDATSRFMFLLEQLDAIDPGDDESLATVLVDVQIELLTHLTHHLKGLRQPLREELTRRFARLPKATEEELIQSAVAEDLEAQRRAVAGGILGGAIGLVEGCRQLVRLTHLVDAADDELIAPILGVESETEDYPTGAARRLWSGEALASKDAAMAAYLPQIQEVVFEVCRKLTVPER